MLILADTGVLLRLLDRADPQHMDVRDAVRTIRQRGDRCVTSPQNAAEFWNVCTRPATARGGLGLTGLETERRLRIIERLFPVLVDSPNTYAHWRNLVVTHGVMGVQAHDAKLAAFMMAHGLTHVLTFNASDFTRYPTIVAMTPAGVLGRSS
jgi:predicted nucleic acid-binding protein